MSAQPPANASENKTPENREAPAALEGGLRWLAPVSAAVLLAATGFIWWQSQRQDQRLDVFEAYLDASRPAEELSARDHADRLTAVAEAYPNQPEAPMALIQAGALLYNEGDYEGALEQYNRFLDTYPDHPLRDNPAWGALHCREAMGDLDAALEGFQAYSPDDALYPQAQLGIARIHEKQGDWSLAREIYENLLNDMPESPWSNQAEIFLQHVGLRENASSSPSDSE